MWCKEYRFWGGNFFRKIAEKTQKNLSLRTILDSISSARKAGLRVGIFCLFGLPMERKEEVQLTFHYLKKIKPEIVNLSLLVPYLGTEIFNFLVRRKKIDKDVWYRYAKGEVPMPVCFSENFPRFIYTMYFLKFFLNLQKNSQIIFHVHTPFLFTLAYVIKQYSHLFFLAEKLWISLEMYPHLRPFVKKLSIIDEDTL